MSELKKFSNITNKQIQSYGVQALADRPNVSSQYGASGLTPAQLKLWFDKLATFLAGRVNDIGDVLSSDEAGSYIRIPLDDAGVGTLSALVESFANGTFAHKILNVYPSVSAYHMVSLQEALYGIAQFMGETEEELGRMKGVGGASFLIGVDNGTHVLSFSLLNEKGEVLKSDSADFSYLVNAARAAAAVEADRASTEADRARDEADRASSEAINALADAKESGVFDGVSVTHVWDGSKLIVTSASGTSESDLRGPEGKRGETGKGFEISKTYASVLQMHADYGNPAVPLYGFVLIDTGNVDDEDNAKLFVKQDDGYQFLIDLSGSEGIKGERGYSAYDTAVQLGFIGSEDEWIASLKKPAEDAASEARASERVRDANENARISDENTRKLNEAAREDAEHQRRAISEDIVTRAENALTLANDAKAEAILSASAAGESERNARSSETAAESARLAAERARDDAEAIVGGNFASDADVSNQIGIHNTNTAAHNDIRLLISGLTERLNTLANSDDVDLDQMKEIVLYIKSNRDLISQITTNKVNVADIVNDLVSNVSNKPLSAAQGVALKALIDAITIPVIPSSVSEVAHQYAISNSKENISDVTTWNNVTNPLTQRQRAIVYGNGYYVVCGTGGEIAYSLDGTTWTSITRFTSDVITGIAFGKGIFVAIDSVGLIWIAKETPFAWESLSVDWKLVGDGTTVILEGVCYANNRFVLVGEPNLVAFSDDGRTWTEKSVAYNFKAVTFGNGKYVGAGNSGAVAVSYDGENWTDYSDPNITGSYRAAAFGAGRYVVGCQAGIIRYSDDGRTWTTATTNSTSSVNYIRGIVYAEGKFYAVMYVSTGKGEIWVSEDGSTWTVQQVTSGRLWCCAYGDGIILTSGDNGDVYALDFGIVWLTKQPELASGQYLWERIVFTLSDGGKVIGDSVFIKELPTTASIVGVADTNYSTFKARAASLNSLETTPSMNGAIAWTYE